MDGLKIPSIKQNERHQPVVYYVSGPGLGVLKIGTTVNLPYRFRRMKNTSPGVSPVLLAWEYGNDSLESHRHAQFSRARVCGDWFVITDELDEHIRELRQEVRLNDEDQTGPRA